MNTVSKLKLEEMTTSPTKSRLEGFRDTIIAHKTNDVHTVYVSRTPSGKINGAAIVYHHTSNNKRTIMVGFDVKTTAVAREDLMMRIREDNDHKHRAYRAFC